MEKPIEFEGEDPLLLEPELRHRSGSMTPGSVRRTRKTPRTAPAGRKLRTTQAAPPATSIVPRLLVRPDNENGPAARRTTEPESDDDDDEVGNDTFVDLKKRRQLPQRSALGSQPPLNASDLKSSDAISEEDTTGKPKSPLIDLSRFVRDSVPPQDSAAASPGPEDEAQDGAEWDAPLFMPASPDSSVGSPIREPSPVPAAQSPVQVVQKEEPVSPEPSRSEAASRSPIFPPSSPPKEPTPAVSLRSSPALHAPSPSLGVSSPMRPPPSSPVVVASPAFQASPALRAPTPGNSNPSPLKTRESLRKSVQVRSHAGKRLSENLRSLSREASEPLSDDAARKSRPSSRLQSPFVGAQDGGAIHPTITPSVENGQGDASENEEDEFDLEGDTVIVADEESIELEETYVDPQDADGPSLTAPAAVDEEAPVAATPQTDVPNTALPTPSQKMAVRAESADADRTPEGIMLTRRTSSVGSGSRRKSRPAECQTATMDGPPRIPEEPDAERPPQTATKQTMREGTAEDPLLLEPALPSVTKSSALRSRQSWLDRVRAKSSTPASPLDAKKSNGPVSSLDRFLAMTPGPEPSHPVPPQSAPRSSGRGHASPDVAQPHSLSSPERSRNRHAQRHSRAHDPSSRHQRLLAEADQEFEAEHGNAFGLADLESGHARDQVSESGSPPLLDFADDSVSEADDLHADEVASVRVEHREVSVHMPNASAHISAETVDIAVEDPAVSSQAKRDEGQVDRSAREQVEDDQRADDKSKSRSPYVSDDSPLADVVNAAIDAGMVIEASSAAGDAIQQSTEGGIADHQTGKASTPPLPPAEDHESSEQETDDEPLMPPRLRRSLHAGATPKRPSILQAKASRPSGTPASERPTTPPQRRPRASSPSTSSVRSPVAVPRPSSGAGSSPFLRDYSSPFMVQPSSSSVAPVVKGSGERSARLQPEIVIEGSSPSASSSPRNGDYGSARKSTAQSATSATPKVVTPSARQDVEHPSSRKRVLESPLAQSLRAAPVPLASVNRPSRPRPVRKSVTPTPTRPRQERPAGENATHDQEPLSAERTAPTPIITSTPRAIRPLPNRGTSVTPRAVPQDPVPPPQSQQRLDTSSRASSRARSKSPLRSFSPKAIGTATAIAATALAAAVPAAASPSPGTIRAQLSPEPDHSPFVRSAVSVHHSVHQPQPNTQSYRSPPRSARSSWLSTTPSAHSVQSAQSDYSAKSHRSRSSLHPLDHSDHFALANSRLAFALAGLSDEDEDDLPPPPTITVTPLPRRARATASSVGPSPASSTASSSRGRRQAAAAPSAPDPRKTPQPSSAGLTATPRSHRTVDAAATVQSTKDAKVATPHPLLSPARADESLGASGDLQSATPRPQSAAATPRTSERAATQTPRPRTRTQTATPLRPTPARSDGKVKSTSLAVNTPRIKVPSEELNPQHANPRQFEDAEEAEKTEKATEAEDDRDIGADDTVIHDIGADDTVDAGSAWDLTAAEFTFDAEMTAFDTHAFRGADWDVTGIERVARGRSEDHRLEDIEEDTERDTASRADEEESSTVQQPEQAAQVQQAEVPAPKTPTRQRTPSRPPSVPQSPVRQSPRLAAKRRAATPQEAPPTARVNGTPAAKAKVSSPSPRRQDPGRRAKEKSPSPSGDATARSPTPITAENENQPAMGEQQETEGEHAAEGDSAENTAPKSHKVTLKVVTRIVKVESDSEDEEITETAETAEPAEEGKDGTKAALELSLEEESAKTSETTEVTVPAPSAPPPAPPPPPALPTTEAQHLTKRDAEDTGAPKEAPSETREPSLLSAVGNEKSSTTKPLPAPLFASKIPLATAGRPSAAPAKSAASQPARITPVTPLPAQPKQTTQSSSSTRTASLATDQRPSTAVSSTPFQPATPSFAAAATSTPAWRTQPSSSKGPTSFVKEQSRQIEQALGRRPAVPSKLSKEVAPSSSPAGSSPIVERADVRPYSRASKDAPVSPSTARERRSDVGDSSFESSASSTRLKRRFEGHLDDEDSRRFAPRASLHEELTAASESGSEFDPEFPSMVAVSSVDPRAAARAAAILKMHHNWIENGILPDGSRVGTPGPRDRSRARSLGALETPRSARRRSVHETPHHSRFSDSIESSRLISKEELLHEAELELVASRSRPGTPFAADSPMRHIPGAWAATPRGRTPKRKRDSDEQERGEAQPGLEAPFQHHSRYDSSTYEGNVDGRSWTKRDWKHLEKVFKHFAAKGSTVDLGAIVDAFLKQTGKEPVGEWSREVLLLRARALARRHGKPEAESEPADERESKRQKTTAPTDAPPSTLRKVMGWLWPSNSKQQETAQPDAVPVHSAEPSKRRRGGDFMQVRDETFDMGDADMSATPSRPHARQHPSPPPQSENVNHAERSFEVDLERGHQSYDIPYEEEEEDEGSFFLEPTTYTARGERSSVTARGERSSVTEASTSISDRHYASQPSISSTRKIYPSLPDLHFPSRPSLASSTRSTKSAKPKPASAQYEESRPAGSRLPVMGTPRPRARVRSDSSIADTSIAARPGSVRDMVRGFEESQELDLSFESARREREKNQLLGLRRVRSVVEKVKEQHQL